MKKALIASLIIILSILTVPALLLTAGCSDSGAAIVAQGKVDNLRWALGDDGCLSFTGTGSIPGVEYAWNAQTGQSDTIYPEWYSYRDQITEVVIGGGVDGLNMNSFMNFPNLSRMDLGATVTHIDGYAVTGCGALERITIRCTAVEMEKFCIGYTGGVPDSTLGQVTFVGAAGSAVEKYADNCGAHFSRL